MECRITRIGPIDHCDNAFQLPLLLPETPYVIRLKHGLSTIYKNGIGPIFLLDVSKLWIADIEMSILDSDGKLIEIEGATKWILSVNINQSDFN